MPNGWELLSGEARFGPDAVHIITSRFPTMLRTVVLAPLLAVDPEETFESLVAAFGSAGFTATAESTTGVDLSVVSPAG